MLIVIARSDANHARHQLITERSWAKSKQAISNLDRDCFVGTRNIGCTQIDHGTASLLPLTKDKVVAANRNK